MEAHKAQEAYTSSQDSKVKEEPRIAASPLHVYRLEQCFTQIMSSINVCRLYGE